MRSRNIVRWVASVTLATGLFSILTAWGSYVWLLPSLKGTLAVAGLWVTVVSVVLMLVPILKVVGAVGMFTSARWSWFVVILSLLLDFVVRASSAVTMFLLAVSDSPAVSLPSSSASATTVIVPLWPTHLAAIVSLVLVLVLSQKPIRDQFRPPTEVRGSDEEKNVPMPQATK